MINTRIDNFILISFTLHHFVGTFWRNRTLIWFYLPQLMKNSFLLGWPLLLELLLKVEAFILVMYLCGLSGSIFLIVPVYINEYCDPCMRASISSTAIIFNLVGMLKSYLLGGLLEYTFFNYTGLTLIVVGLVYFERIDFVFSEEGLGRVSYVCTIVGMLIALPSSTLRLFSSENTTLDRIMTETELSLMGSISSGSTLLITPFCGYLLDKFGRKRTLIFFYLPQLVGWVVLTTLHRVEAFIFAMFLSGLSNSIFLIVLVYINEYCDPSLRGGLCTTAIISNIGGMLISYLLGGLLEYNNMNYTGLSMTVVGLILISFLKESPLYLMKKGLEEEAARSLAFYAGAKINSEKVITQMKNIRQLLNTDIESSDIPEEQKLKLLEKKDKKRLSLCSYFVKSRSTRRALVSLLILYTLCVFQGIIVVQVFAGPLFAAAVPSMTAYLSSILFAFVSIGAGYVGAYVIDKAGRRILLIVASMATGFLCVILGTLIQFDLASGLLSAVFIYLYAITYTLGAGAVPNVLLGEVFLPEIKGFATTVCVEWYFTCNFIILFMFNPLFNAYGLGPLFYFFGTIGFLTALFSYIYIPETKNLPVDLIQEKFLKRIKF